jgi:hypothetical protein
VFLRKDGHKVILDCVGQAWQRGDVVEFVLVRPLPLYTLSYQ